MRRVKFKEGEQREFLEKVITESGAPSLRSLNQFGFDVPYSTLKNYFNESRHIPEGFFLDLCELIGANPSSFEVTFLEESYGQRKGGLVSKK